MSAVTRVSAVFYHSKDPISVIAALCVKLKYPTTEFYDIAGLNPGAVTALCNGLTAVSYHDIWVVCDKAVSQFTECITAGDIVILATKLIAVAPGLDPMPDASVQDYTALDNGQPQPDLQLRTLLVFAALFPTKPISKIVFLLGDHQLSAADQAKSIALYYGLRAQNKTLSDSDFLQTLKDITDKESRLNLDNSIAASIPQDIAALVSLIAEGITIVNFIAATGVAVPEAPIVVPG